MGSCVIAGGAWGRASRIRALHSHAVAGRRVMAGFGGGRGLLSVCAGANRPGPGPGPERRRPPPEGRLADCGFRALCRPFAGGPFDWSALWAGAGGVRKGGGC